MEEPEEDDNIDIPCSPYAAAKWASSGYARMFHALYGTPVVTARIFMVYGPAQQDLNKLIPYVTLSLLRNEAPKLTVGKRKIDWIYVTDVVEGLIMIAIAEDVEGCIVDLGSGSLVSIRTIVQHLVDFIDPHIEPLFGELPDRPGEQERIADVENTYKMIGWKPRISLQRGLKVTIDWYRTLQDTKT
jgi:nucleoside-diphosphate-sugar epimerase